MEKKPMRALMPRATEVVDAFRARGLTDNTAIAKGIQAGTFWAKEGAHAVGTPRPRENGVAPVLSFAAERRHLDREWKAGTWQITPQEARVREMNRQWMERGRKSMEEVG